MAYELPLHEVNFDTRLDSFRSRLQPTLAKDLARGPDDLLWDLDRTNWETTVAPEVAPSFQADIGAVALRSILDDFEPYFPDQRLAKEFVFANMLQYAGVRPVDESGRRWARLEREYSPTHSFPFATQTLFGRGKLVGIRAVPASFQDHDQLRTPFTLQKHPESGVLFAYDDGDLAIDVAQATELRPLQSAREIVYYRELQRPGANPAYRIVANPVTACAERCSFCVRQYDTVGNLDLGAEEPFVRSRLSPEEMAQYTFLKFEHLRPANVTSIGLVTGAFPNFDSLYNYTGKFIAAIERETDGNFDPRHNDEQEVFLLTHLITEPDQMKAMRALGVSDVSHTLEVIDDDRRLHIMPPYSADPRIVNKGSVSFEQALSAVSEGVNIFGPDHFRAIVIVGLDDLDTTVQGTRELHRVGMTSLDMSIFRAHSVKSLGDYAMSFPDIMKAKKHIIDTFNPKRIR